MTTAVETTKRCDANLVKVGSVFSRHSFGTVIDMNAAQAQARLRNEKGFEWSVSKDIIEQEFSFADQQVAEEVVSRTRAIEVVTENPFTAMTINFCKAVDAGVVADALRAGQGAETDKSWKKRVKELLEGEERTMIGYHTGSFDEHRRLKFTEINVGQRLVDVRTLNWVIVNRIQYKVK